MPPMLGFDILSEFAVIGVLVLVIGLGLIAVALFIPSDYSVPFYPQRLAQFFARPFARRAMPTSPFTPAALGDETTGPVVAVTRQITWPALIDASMEALAPAERRRVLEGFGIVGDAWSASVLAKAFDEEDDELRVTAIESLAQCEGPLVLPMLERAYASYAVPERYAATDGASRRGEVALLERALRDTDGTVALAAAYGLHRAHRDDLIERALTDRQDARANEIRRVLPMLA
jgi:hypothetical protein